ncbi:hypothetical protein MMC25_004934 [Agyrium rufum]|nr:hypothetical protein [Agyrium rufum]
MKADWLYLLQGVANRLPVAGALYALVLLLSTYVLYLTLFHPLAKHPGPFVAKLTRPDSVYHAFKGDRHTDFLTLHKKYGSIVRFGPNHISINKAGVLEQINGHKINVRKSSWYSGFFSISIFNAIDHQVHARKKRVTSQAFSDQAIRAMEPHILSAIRD